jgi:hypothetical protein
MKPSNFRDVTGRVWQLFADISEQPIGSTSNNQAHQLECKEVVDTIL